MNKSNMQNLDRFNFKIAIHSKKINGCDLPCGVYDVFGFQKSFTLLQKIENNTNTTKKVLSIDFFDALEIIGNQFESPELIENI